MHKLGVAVSGGVGGFFGVSVIAIELPISTSIILRSIADVARSETESGCYAVRAMLSKSLADASEFLVSKVLTDEGAPVLIRLISMIAKRFSIQVTEKAVAQAIPAIGAAGGSN